MNIFRTNAASYFLLDGETQPPVTPAPAPAAPPAATTPPASPAPSAVTAGADPGAETPPKEGEPPKPAEAAKPLSAVTTPSFDGSKLQLPEGMQADHPTIKSFNEIMGDEKLSAQDRGQKLINLYNDAVKESREAAKTAWDGVNAEWAQQTMADPDIGGPKWNATKATIAKVIDGLGADLAAGFRQALDATGAGNHPAIVKALHQWASMFTEGKHVAGTPPGGQPEIGPTFFPNSKMKG